MSVELTRQDIRAIIYDHYLSPEFAKKPKTIHAALCMKYGSQAPHVTTVQRWCNEFGKFGRTRLKDAERSGRPNDAVTDSNIQRCRRLIEDDRKVSKRELSNILNISVGSVYAIISHHLHCRKVMSKWVPHTLTDDQRATRVRCCKQLLRRFRVYGDHFLNQIITQDESKFTLWNPPTNQESKEWVFPDDDLPSRQRTSRTRAVVMLSIWWDKSGGINVNFIPHGTTMNGNKYEEEIKQLRLSLPGKRRGMLIRKPLLLIDNAPCHRANQVHATATKLGFQILEHPPYSPDLAPSDFYLFTALKKFTRGKVWSNCDELQSTIRRWIADQPAEWYRAGIYRCPDRWKKCIEADGHYFE